VDSYHGQSLDASAQDVVLPNGWHVNASLSEIRGTNLQHGRAYLYLDVWTTYPCWGEVCESHSSADAEVPVEQVVMDRSLRTASVENVSVELVDPAAWLPDPLPDAEGPGAGGEEPWTGEDPGTGGEEPWTGEDPGTGGENPDFPTPVEPEPLTLTVSLSFTGVGPIDRTATHITMCSDGDRECQSVRVEAHRDAVAQLVLGDQTGETTAGRLFFGRHVDAAAPKYQFDEF